MTRTDAAPPGAQKSPQVEDCLCFRARLVARRLTEFYETRLVPHGLNIPQFGLLGAIGAERQASISQLAQRLELDPSTLSRTLHPLRQAGLIDIFADPDNLRVRRVKLTAEGKARVREAAKAWARAQADAAEIVSGDAMAAIVEATARLK
jgi:DNA-binding MarR family transcriptional regulator